MRPGRATRSADPEAAAVRPALPCGSSSGLHVRMSLADRDGVNRFAHDDRELGHAVAGLQATMAEAMLLFAPHGNSFRRLRPLSYAPTAPTRGHDNRTVALRVPAGAPDAPHRAPRRRRRRQSLPGARGRPRRHPPRAHARAPAERADRGRRLRPGRPQPAAELGARSRRLPGRASCATISARPSAACIGVCRAAERDRFADVVTPTEYAWYLNTV